MSPSFWENKSVVIPGGAGFIGSHLVDHLVAAGASVTAIDNLHSGNWQRLAAHGNAIQRITADLTSADLQKIFSGADAVLNLAGHAPGLTLDSSRHETLYRKNLHIAGAVLEGVLSASVPNFLAVSSSCVYPDEATVPTPEMSLTGTSPERANIGYGKAKREIESRAIAAAASRPDLKLTVARPFNAFGARDTATGSGAHVIPSLLEKVLSPTPEIVVWGSGKQTRSFIHASDLARALALLVEHHTSTVPVNIGTNQEISIRNLIAKLCELTGIEKRITFDTSKPEGASRKACDASLLKSITGFTPEISLEDGLHEIVHERMAFRNTPAEPTASPAS